MAASFKLTHGGPWAPVAELPMPNAPMGASYTTWRDTSCVGVTWAVAAWKLLISVVQVLE